MPVLADRKIHTIKATKLLIERVKKPDLSVLTSSLFEFTDPQSLGLYNSVFEPSRAFLVPVQTVGFAPGESLHMPDVGVRNPGKVDPCKAIGSDQQACRALKQYRERLACGSDLVYSVIYTTASLLLLLQLIFSKEYPPKKYCLPSSKRNLILKRQHSGKSPQNKFGISGWCA